MHERIEIVEGNTFAPRTVTAGATPWYFASDESPVGSITFSSRSSNALIFFSATVSRSQAVHKTRTQKAPQPPPQAQLCLVFWGILPGPFGNSPPVTPDGAKCTALRALRAPCAAQPLGLEPAGHGDLNAVPELSPCGLSDSAKAHCARTIAQYSRNSASSHF